MIKKTKTKHWKIFKLRKLKYKHVKHIYIAQIKTKHEIEIDQKNMK